MSLLIDGYNLLHASGILPRGIGPSTLERARAALVNFLAAAIDPEELAQTTIVFDAADAPPGLPDVYQSQGLTVRFAQGYATADELIEKLIRSDSAPRQLTVVSSDHQIQRAARRRRAKAVDSDPWIADLKQQRRSRRRQEPETDIKPHAPLGEIDVQRWLDEFGEVDIDLPTPEPPPVTDDNAPNHGGKAKDIDDLDLANPFPPGYAEDLLDDDE